jgi:hypothetical protein
MVLLELNQPNFIQHACLMHMAINSGIGAYGFGLHTILYGLFVIL